MSDIKVTEGGGGVYGASGSEKPKGILGKIKAKVGGKSPANAKKAAGPARFENQFGSNMSASLSKTLSTMLNLSNYGSDPSVTLEVLEDPQATDKAKASILKAVLRKLAANPELMKQFLDMTTNTDINGVSSPVTKWISQMPKSVCQLVGTLHDVLLACGDISKGVYPPKTEDAFSSSGYSVMLVGIKERSGLIDAYVAARKANNS